MTRATSNESYRLLVESGALKGKQAHALQLVIAHGPGTAAEILAGSSLDRNRNLARARFTELQARGLIREVSERVCAITGRRALVWEYTGRTNPLDLKKGTGVSKKTLAATLLRICAIADEATSNEAAREATKEARALAAKA